LYLLIGLQRNILFQVKPTCDWVSATVSSLRLVGHKRKCIRNFSAGRSLWWYKGEKWWAPSLGKWGIAFYITVSDCDGRVPLKTMPCSVGIELISVWQPGSTIYFRSLPKSHLCHRTYERGVMPFLSGQSNVVDNWRPGISSLKKVWWTITNESGGWEGVQRCQCHMPYDVIINTRRRSLDSDISWNLCSVLLSPTCQPIPYRFVNQVNFRKILILRYRSPTSPFRPLRRSYMISSREYILSSSPPFWLIDKQILWPVSPETCLVFFS